MSPEEIGNAMVENMHENIERFIADTSREGEKPKTENNQWILKSKQGNIPFDIIHPLGKSFIYIVLDFKLNEAEMNLLKGGLSKSEEIFKFNYDLRSTIMISNLSYSFRNLRTTENENIYVGFEIKSRIFPSDKFYSEKHLEDAIQNVINSGVLGMHFFGLKLASSKELRKQLEELNSSSDGMYS